MSVTVMYACKVGVTCMYVTCATFPVGYVYMDIFNRLNHFDTVYGSWTLSYLRTNYGTLDEKYIT